MKVKANSDLIRKGTWNYRLFRYEVLDGGELRAFYRLTETYYDSNGSPTSYATPGKCPVELAESPQALAHILTKLSVAVGKPVLMDRGEGFKPRIVHVPDVLLAD